VTAAASSPAVTTVGATAAAALLLPILLVAAAATALLGTGSHTSPSAAAVADIPAGYLALYARAAATCPGLDWSVLAAVGKVESDHGRSTLPGVRSGANHAGAQGPMQFLPATFNTVVADHAPPPGGANPPSPYNPHDAIHTAAAYLCNNGAHNRADLAAALWAYNHGQAYIDRVLATAAGYTAHSPDGGPATQQAITWALGQLGMPYVWGGDGAYEGGFDCSGLTHAAYAAAGIQLPRTAQTQHDAGPAVPPGQPLQPGDLVYYGTPTDIHHVGLYIGNKQMINAPQRGQPVQIAPYRWPGDDYHGATRPASS
jgi:cell wall-associated NlpC family hydrolase